MVGLRRLWAMIAIGLALTPPAAAHRLAPSLLSLEERRAGVFELSFKTPRQRPAGVEVAPELPTPCVASEPPRAAADEASLTLHWSIDCGVAGLVGTRIGIQGLAASSTNALVHIQFQDGRRVRAVLHGGEPSFIVPARVSAWQVARDYLRLGAAHIASGFDHLLFVFGLLLLAAGARQLVATVTAFTVGHSVTLSLASLGFVRFPSALAEWLIAVTILALALELARRPPRAGSLLRRRPWAVACGFGLLHGLGFAGALAEVGLPEEEIPLALLSFNVGIEFGQLAFVAGVLALRALLPSTLGRLPGWLQEAPVTVMGALAVYWCIDRSMGLI